MNSKLKILVTVGTTQFEELIQYVDSEQFLQLIAQVDGTHLEQEKPAFRNFQILAQIGAKATYLPKNIDYIRLSDKISQIYSQSDFIICHGGAGTLLENLKNGKKIIAVANNTLAGNHQVQLVTKLAKEGYLLSFKTVKQLKQNPQQIKQLLMNKIKFQQYSKPIRSILNDLIFEDA